MQMQESGCHEGAHEIIYGCVKCEQLMEEKPEEGVLLFFHKIPFQKQVMHEIVLCSALREPDNLSCIGSVSVFQWYINLQNMWRTSALWPLLGNNVIIKVLEEELANVKLEKIFCFSALHFICTSQNILSSDLTQLDFSFFFFFKAI